MREVDNHFFNESIVMEFPSEKVEMMLSVNVNHHNQFLIIYNASLKN